MRNRLAALGVAALAGITTLALAAPAHATEEVPGFTAVATQKCGEVEITFTNPTNWVFAFDWRVEGDPFVKDVDPELEGVEIAEGPLAGQEFGPTWNVVVVNGAAAEHSKTVSVPWDEDLQVRLALGAEQHLFFDWTPVNVEDVEACPEPEESPSASPSASASSTSAPPAAGGSLPVTGASVAGLAVGGVALLGAGAGLLLARRRRVKFTA